MIFGKFFGAIRAQLNKLANIFWEADPIAQMQYEYEMAVEQLKEGRVDARSDLFSAALVLVLLVSGWRRTNAQTLVPPDGTVTDPALVVVLARALAETLGHALEREQEF